MSELPRETEFRPSIVRDALKHHPWALVALGVLGASVGLGAALAAPVTHESTAVVLVNPLYGNPFTPDGQGNQLVNIETEAQLVATDAVGALAAKKIGTDIAAAELARTARGTVTSNTQVIKVVYQSSTPEVARQRAQAFAESFLDYRRTRAKTLIDTQLDLLRRQEASTREQLAKAAAQLAAQKEGSPARTLTTEQIRTHATELTRLTSQIAEQSAIPTDPGQVISPARTPTDGRPLAMLLYGLAGGAIGLIVGALGAITRERLDDRIRDVDDLERLSVPWLGSMKEQLAWLGGDEIGEEQRRMRTALLTALPTRPVVIAVGRADSHKDAPASIRPLAVALARSSVRVCMVHATIPDWPGENAARYQETDGLAGVVLHDLPLEKVTVHLGDNIDMVPPGRWSDEVSDQLGNERVRQIVSRLRERYDIVLIAVPNLQSADGQTLARRADTVLLESTIMSTRNADLIMAIDQLNRAGIPVLGSVLVTRLSTLRSLRRSRRAVAAGKVIAQASLQSSPAGDGDETVNAGAVVAMAPTAGGAQGSDATRADSPEKTSRADDTVAITMPTSSQRSAPEDRSPGRW